MKQNILLAIFLLVTSQSSWSQCFPDRHSTNFFDGWISCEAAKNPNELRPPGHFIMYDFGKTYQLGQMKIWNTNDPSHLDWGMRDVAIDYSIDGENWINAGYYTFPPGTGLSTYEGDEGPHLNDIIAQYLLITAINNYGGSCYGFSEMHVDGEEVLISDVDEVETLDCIDVTMYPNPFADKLTLNVHPGCNGTLRYVLYDALGHELFNQNASLTSGENRSFEIGGDLPSGSYLLFIEFGGSSVQKSIIKLNRT